MADLDHNLSLADALTEPPPEIEEEVKRDFIATLEAEKFDDVVGETVDKTDYVPLLDDDDAKAGSQEPKSKPHADGIQVEHTPASGPVVVQNGDHGIEDHRTVFPGEIMDEKLSYKDYLDRNDSWAMDDRDLCFESQPMFKPMEMADPFAMHRGENLPDLSFPTDMKSVPLFTDHVDASGDIHAPHGSMVVPEQPFLGPLYSAEALDPSAFIGLDSAAEFLHGKAVPEEHWMGVQRDMQGPDASFFVEPPVPPDVPESPAAPARGPTALTASPGGAGATEAPKGVTSADAACVPASDVTSVSAEKAGSLLAGDTSAPQALYAGFGPAPEANPPQALDLGFGPAPEAKHPNAVSDASAPAAVTAFTPAADAAFHCATGLEFAPAEDAESHHAMDLAFAPAADVESHHAMDLAFAPAADVESHQTLDSEFAPAADVKSHHAMDLAFAPAADVKSHHAMDLAFAPAADVESHQTLDSEFAPAADVKSHHAMDLAFAPAADVESHHALDSEFAPAADAEFAPAAEVNHYQAMDSGFAPVVDTKPLPAMDSGFAFAEVKSVSDTKAAASQELVTSESSVEQFKSPFNKPLAEATGNVALESEVPAACTDLLEKAPESQPPPSHHEEHPPEQRSHLAEPAVPADRKEAVALENNDLLPEKSVTTADVTDTEKQKEEAEHNHVQHAEPQQEQTLQEPTGLPTAQIKQANKASERRFGRAKPAPLPITDVPEERPIGLPQLKSTDPKVDPCSVEDLGCVAGASPRTRVSHKKATEQLSEFVESCRDVPRESWGLEGSLAIVKKKKKKPKQKRNQLPRTTEFWDENVMVSKAPRNSPFAVELQKPEVCPIMPAGARREQSLASGSRASDMPKDAKITTGSCILDEQNASSVPAQRPGVPLGSVGGAENGDGMRTEGMRDGGLVLQSKERRKEVPLEQVGKMTAGESVSTKVPTQPMGRDFPDTNEKRGCKGSKPAELMPPLSAAINTGKAETPLETQPSELLLSARGKEAKPASPQREAFSDTTHQELQASRGSLEVAAQKRGDCEKSKGVENDPFEHPALLEAVAPSSELPNKPKAADDTKPASSATCTAAVDCSSAEGGLKTPTDTTKMPVPPLVLPKPGEAVALQTREADGFSEQPFLLSTRSDAAKPPASAGAQDRAMGADSPDKNKGKGFTALEQQTGRDPSIAHGMDRPKKKRGEGKVKKIKSFSEQMMLWEDVRTDETIKETTFPAKGRGAAPRGHPSVSVPHAYPADKPKKRGSDGRSKKGERSFFQQPFVESQIEQSSFPDVTDKTKDVADKGRERGCGTGRGGQERAPDVTEMQRPVELVPEPKENVGKNELPNLGGSDQPFLLQSRREDAKQLAVADTPSKTKEVDLMDGGKEGGVTSGSEVGVINSDAALVADRARKRCSDGKRKKPEKSPVGQAAVLAAEVDTSNLPSEGTGAGSTKGIPLDKDKVSDLERELLLEDLTGITKEVLAKPEIQGGNRSFSSQPVLSGHKTQPAEPEIVSTKDTWPLSTGKEPDPPKALPEHGVDTAVAHSPAREVVVDKPKKKSRDLKGKKAENGLVVGPGAIPAVGKEVGNIKQTQTFDKGKEAKGSTAVSLLAEPVDPTEAGVPALPLEPEGSHTSGKEKCKAMEVSVQQPFPLEQNAGPEVCPPRGVQPTDKAGAEGPTPSSTGGGPPVPEHPAAAGHTSDAVTGRSKKRSCDGTSSAKADRASEQPVPEAEPSRSEAPPPLGSQVARGMEDMDLVDENRNIKNFPVGPQVLWSNKGSGFECFAQTAVSRSGNAGEVSSGSPKQRGEGPGGKGLPPPPEAEKSSNEPGSGVAEEARVQKPREPARSLGQEEPGEEVSKNDGGAKEGGSVRKDIASKQDEVRPSPVAQVGGKEIGTADEKRSTDSASPGRPQEVAADRPAAVGAKGPEKPEATVCAGEQQSPGPAAMAEGAVAAAVPRAGAGALAGGTAGAAGLGEQYPGTLGGEVAQAEAAGLDVTAAQTSQACAEEEDGHPRPAGEAAAHLRGAPALRPRVERPEGTAKGKEGEQKAAKEAKKEGAKAAGQIRSYMRPTKARGAEAERQARGAGGAWPRREQGVCVPCELAAAPRQLARPPLLSVCAGMTLSLSVLRGTGRCGMS